MTLRHQVVAIVENDPSMLQGVEYLLHAHGYLTECYCSAEAFLAAASKATCLVLDIGLDGMSGIELRRRLTASGSTLAVIFMTGADDEATRQQAIEAGCVAYLPKPFPADCLLAAINGVTHSEPLPRDESTQCSRCGATTKLIKRIPKLASLPELLTFECTACAHVETTVNEDEE